MKKSPKLQYAIYLRYQIKQMNKVAYAVVRDLSKLSEKQATIRPYFRTGP